MKCVVIFPEWKPIHTRMGCCERSMG